MDRRKGIVTLTSVELMQVVLKNVEKQIQKQVSEFHQNSETRRYFL